MKQQQQSILGYLHTLENGIVAAVVIAIIVLAFLQIVMRNIFATGIAWISPLLGVLVLWAALLGALVATRQGDHIRINVLSHYLPDRFQPYIRIINNLFSTAVIATTAFYSVTFVLLEMESPTSAFANVPVWIAEIILPVAFSIMAARFLLIAILEIVRLIKQGGKT